MAKQRVSSLRSLPKKALQPQLTQPRACLLATRTVGCHQFFVNHRSRLPFLLLLQQPGGIKSGLVKPEEFRRLVRRRIKLQNLVEGRERAVGIRFFFKANSFLKKSLVAPMWLICG